MRIKPNARSLLRTESSGSASVTWLDREAARRAAESAARSLAERHPEVVRILLFGSLVRGDAVPGSDADLLVVLSGSDLSFVDRIAHYAPEPIGLPIDVFPYTEAEVERLRDSPPSLVHTALQEGVVVVER